MRNFPEPLSGLDFPGTLMVGPNPTEQIETLSLRYLCGELFLQHFVVALLLLLISIPVIFLIPFLMLALGLLEALRVGIIRIIKQYLNRHLYGWIIGYNRLVDAKTHNATQQNTKDLLFDLFLNNRYN